MSDRDRFFEEGTRLLTPPAFEFMLDGELKRAVRSQNYLTLVVVETKREWEGFTLTADDGTVEALAHLMEREVRDTDVIGHTDRGMLSLMLLDSDSHASSRVIDRLIQRIESYEFPAPLQISMGAACYPTDAVDADSLKRQAVSHPVVNWRGGLPRGSAH